MPVSEDYTHNICPIHCLHDVCDVASVIDQVVDWLSTTEIGEDEHEQGKKKAEDMVYEAYNPLLHGKNKYVAYAHSSEAVVS